jgi:hypothetical protein
MSHKGIRIETPRGAVVKSKNGVRATLKWNPDFVDEWQGSYDAAQVFVDNEVLRLSDPYVPFQSGLLKKTGILGTIPGRGEVIWNAPYARYHYYGKVMIGRAPKELTDEDLRHRGAPKRGAFWFERMKKDKLNQILVGARRIAAGGTK